MTTRHQRSHRPRAIARVSGPGFRAGSVDPDCQPLAAGQLLPFGHGHASANGWSASNARCGVGWADFMAPCGERALVVTGPKGTALLAHTDDGAELGLRPCGSRSASSAGSSSDGGGAVGVADAVEELGGEVVILALAVVWKAEREIEEVVRSDGAAALSATEDRAAKTVGNRVGRGRQSSPSFRGSCLRERAAAPHVTKPRQVHITKGIRFRRRLR